MVRHLRTRYFLHLAQGIHAAVIMGVMPLIGLLCATWATVAYGATTSVTLGVGPTSIVVSGKTAPSSFITILDGNSVVGTTVADAGGTFSKKISAVSPGVHRLHIYSRDMQNRLTDSIQIEMSATEHFQTDVYVFLPPSLATDTATINPGQPITYRGSTYPGATIALLFNDEDTYQVTADAQGQWSYLIDTTDLPLGIYEAFVQATDEASGEQSYRSKKLAVSIIEPTPEPLPSSQQPTPAQPTSRTPPKTRSIRPTTIQTPENTNLSDPVIILQGTAEPLSQVEVFNGGRPIGSTFADKNGKWKLQITLQDLEYAVRARACNRVVCSDFSNTVQLFYRPLNTANLFTAWLDQYAFVVRANQTAALLTHLNNGDSPFTATIDWHDGTKDTTKQQVRNFTLHHTYQHAGQYKGTLTITDDSNRSVTLVFSVLVTETATAQTFTWPLLILILAILFGIFTTGYVYWRLRRHRAH